MVMHPFCLHMACCLIPHLLLALPRVLSSIHTCIQILFSGSVSGETQPSKIVIFISIFYSSYKNGLRVIAGSELTMSSKCGKTAHKINVILGSNR